VLVEQVGSHVAAFSPADMDRALAWAQQDEQGQWSVCWPGQWNVQLEQARHMAHALATLVASIEMVAIANAPTSDLAPTKALTAYQSTEAACTA
jgi:hypothetical protein